MPDLAALIARLEAATEGSRELDGLIWRQIEPEGEWVAIHGTWHRKRTFTAGTTVGATDKYEEKTLIEYQPPRFFTTSLDAAMSLVPDGWPWAIYTDGGRSQPSASVITTTDDGEYEKSTHHHAGATIALALCIASLRARQERG